MQRLAQVLFIATLVWAASCPPRYRGGFLNVTDYKVGRGRRTPGGVLVVGDVPGERVDQKVAELDACLRRAGFSAIRKKRFGVFVPPDWYVSKCSGEQLIPSRMPCRLCTEAKGLPLPQKCCGLAKPTLECPCVCNARAAIQDDFWIVTAPNLKLFKAELARLVTGVNNPWKDDRLHSCL